LHSNIQEKKVLLIFENIDCLLKNSKTQFNWWLMSLAQQWEDMKIIMTSKKEINLKSHQKLYKLTLSFKLKTLNDIEAVDMILSNCKRQITKDELLMHEDTP